MRNKEIMQKIIVGGVLIDNNKILILQRSEKEKIYPNLWELPSGKKKLLEKTEEALAREFKEETNIDIKIINVISIFDYVIEKSDEINDSTQINFLVNFLNENKDVKISKEHRDYAWIDEVSLDKFGLTELTKEVLKKAFSFCNTKNS